MATPKAAPKAPKTDAKPDLLARYECDGFRFPDRDYYDRHVVFDHVVRMEGRDPAGAVRGGRPHAPRRARPALAQDRRDLRPGEPEAGVLPVDGVPDRPVAGQQHRQPGRRGVRPRGPSSQTRGRTGRRCWRRSRTPGWATAASAGWPRASSTRWPRSRSPPSATACGTTTASSGRNSRDGLPGRAAGPVADAARPVGGRPAERDGRRSRSPRRSRLQHGRDRRPSRAADAAARHPVRPAGRRVTAGKTINTLRLWQAGDRRTSSTSASSAAATSSGPCPTRSWPSRSPACCTRTTRRPAAGRCGSSRSTSSSAARWPTSSPGSADAGTTGPRCRTRWRSS